MIYEVSCFFSSDALSSPLMTFGVSGMHVSVFEYSVKKRRRLYD